MRGIREPKVVFIHQKNLIIYFRWTTLHESVPLACTRQEGEPNIVGNSPYTTGSCEIFWMKINRKIPAKRTFSKLNLGLFLALILVTFSFIHSRERNWSSLDCWAGTSSSFIEIRSCARGSNCSNTTARPLSSRLRLCYTEILTGFYHMWTRYIVS